MKAHFERSPKKETRRLSGLGKTSADTERTTPATLPKTALLWGLAPDSPALVPLRAAARRGVTLHTVTPQELDTTVAVLCGIPGAAGPGRTVPDAATPAGSLSSTHLPIPAGPALILCGLPEPEREALLEALRAAGAVIPLKAIVTPTNQSWPFAGLLAELAREHTALHGGAE